MIKKLYRTSDGRTFNNWGRAEAHDNADFDTWLKASGYDKFLDELNDSDKCDYSLTDRGVSEYVFRLVFERDNDR